MELLPSKLAEGYRSIGLLAFDTETSGLYADSGARVSTVSLCFEGYEEDNWTQYDNVNAGWEQIAPNRSAYLVSVAWPFDQGTEGKLEDKGQFALWPEAWNLDKDEWQDLLQILIAHPGLVAHDCKFDCEKMRVGCRRWPKIGVDLIKNTDWDTLIGNAMLWPLEYARLKERATHLFGKEWADEAAVVKRYLQKAKLPTGRWDLMPWDIIGLYADTDARLCKMTELRQRWEMKENGGASWLGTWGDVNHMFWRRLGVMRTLYAMEKRGLPYDEVGSREAGLEARTRAATLVPKLPFRPTGDAAKAYFFTDKGLDLIPYEVTEKGAPSLTAEVLARMVDDGIPHAETWAEWNKVSNAASMWYEGYADAMGQDGRLRTCFRQNGTRSTRYSVERVNLQAIPQDYRLSDHSILAGIPTPRELIARAVARMDGWRLFELDLAQAELRVGALFADAQSMLDMMVKGEDLHGFTTCNLFPQIDPDGPQWGKYRQVGKRGNFSLGFGSGGTTFRKMVSKETGIQLEPKESERIVRDWNALYPEWSRAIKKHQKVVEKRQQKFGHAWVAAINGERRWFQEYEEAHKAFNQRVQLNLGQFAMDWMLLTDDYLVRRGLDKEQAGLVLTIHDSQVLLLPDDEEGKELAETCAQFGRGLWKEWFPGVPGGVDYHSWTY